MRPILSGGQIERVCFQAFTFILLLTSIYRVTLPGNLCILNCRCCATPATMVKFIKPKPLSKREMKDLQRTMSPQIASPLMHTASPIMPFPDSPFLDNHDFNLVESPSGSLNTRQRKQRSVTRKATRDRLLPRARKPGGRHKPIVISSSPSPPRTPIIPSDTDSGYVAISILGLSDRT